MLEATLRGDFLRGLINGEKKECSILANRCFEETNTIIPVYEELIKPSMYMIGELWELNKISVATEHLASAIIESILNELYYKLEFGTKKHKRVIVSCIEKEFHQVGSKMVADVFEKEGWDVLYLGANTPKNSLFEFIRLMQPDLLALSLSIYFHFPYFEELLQNLEAHFPNLSILVGGQALLHCNDNELITFKNVTYLKDLNQVEQYLN